ncbi:MAG TPA: TetR family transcriptional regulator [Acidimicrobiales bacterium]|nr:TetR family transcriptional regulator [Acidimicrobiales bacterium]
MEADRVVPVRSGRGISRRGRDTRQRLLDGTRDLLDESSYRAVRVVDIARAAGTSPATFYQYFPGVESAVLALAESLADQGAVELRALVANHRWDRAALQDSARALAQGFLDFWERNGALMTVIDHASLEGDQRFRQIRTRLLNGVTVALQDVAVASTDENSREARAVAGVLTSMLSHVAAHRRGLEDWGIDRGDLRATMARIIADVLGG